MDQLDTTYTTKNSDFNHIFKNYNQNSDGTQKYVQYGGFYFSNVVAEGDYVLYDNFNGINYQSRTPEVNIIFY